MSSITTEYIDPATGKKVKPQRAVGTAHIQPTDSIIAAFMPTPTQTLYDARRAVKRNGLHQRRRKGYARCTSGQMRHHGYEVRSPIAEQYATWRNRRINVIAQVEKRLLISRVTRANTGLC